MSAVKAIIVDSFDQTVEYIEIDGYQDIQKNVWPHESTTFGCITMPDNHVIYYDDEAYVREKCPHGWVNWPDAYPHPLANNLVIVGTDDEGGDIDVTWTLDKVRKEVEFRNEFNGPNPEITVVWS